MKNCSPQSTAATDSKRYSPESEAHIEREHGERSDQ